MHIYLDNAATTRPDPEVVKAMNDFLLADYGNPGSLHKMGKAAAKAVEIAREQTAMLFNADAENIIFTSGGSEGNSMVFNGVADMLLRQGKNHIIVFAAEHDSVLKAANSLIKRGFDISYLMPKPDGSINPDVLRCLIRPNTGLVSVMFANNETGVISPVGTIGNICKKHNILYHCDCVQAAGFYDIDVKKNNIDFATMSAHKIHGPKGVGAIYIKDKAHIEPLVHGGANQEYGLRGGTQNVPGIVALGTAAKLAMEKRQANVCYITNLKQRFFTNFVEYLEFIRVDSRKVKLNGSTLTTPGKVLNFRVEGIDSETLVLLLSAKDIYLSAGSACQSLYNTPSHVLTAMGLSEDEAKSSIRVSFSKFNQGPEVVLAAQNIAESIKELLTAES